MEMMQDYLVAYHRGLGQLAANTPKKERLDLLAIGVMDPPQTYPSLLTKSSR